MLVVLNVYYLLLTIKLVLSMSKTYLFGKVYGFDSFFLTSVFRQCILLN